MIHEWLDATQPISAGSVTPATNIVQHHEMMNASAQPVPAICCACQPVQTRRDALMGLLPWSYGFDVRSCGKIDNETVSRAADQ